MPPVKMSDVTAVTIAPIGGEERRIEAITSFTGPHEFLSTSFRCEVRINGRVFGSAEAAFQSEKVIDSYTKDRFAEMDPESARLYGEQVPKREDWLSIRVPVMRAILFAKFMASPTLQTLLDETRDAQFINGLPPSRAATMIERGNRSGINESEDLIWGARFRSAPPDEAREAREASEAREVGGGIWEGENWLGRLLMELRTTIAKRPIARRRMSISGAPTDTMRSVTRHAPPSKPLPRPAPSTPAQMMRARQVPINPPPPPPNPSTTVIVCLQPPYAQTMSGHVQSPPMSATPVGRAYQYLPSRIGYNQALPPPMGSVPPPPPNATVGRGIPIPYSYPRSPPPPLKAQPAHREAEHARIAVANPLPIPPSAAIGRIISPFHHTTFPLHTQTPGVTRREGEVHK